MSCLRKNHLIPVRLESGTCRSRTLDFTSEPQRTGAQTEICILYLVICILNPYPTKQDSLNLSTDTVDQDQNVHCNHILSTVSNKV